MPIPFHTAPVTTLPSRSGACMYAKTEELRRLGPAVPVELPDGLTAWSVVRGETVSYLLTHPDVSRDVTRAVPTYETGEVPWLAPWIDLQNMTTKDGADHSRLRRVVVPSLTYRRIQQLRPAIENTVRGLIEDLANKADDTPVDVHAAFSYQIPTLVICDLLGIPEDQRPEVLRVFRLVARTDALSEDEATQLNLDLLTAMRTLIDEKRAHPGDDLTSILIIESQKEEDPLTEDELIATLLLMIGGGSQTTINLIDHALADLTACPHARQSLIRGEDPRPIIEESLRKDCPVMNLPMRWALADIDLGEGVMIRTGEPILLNYGGHGRDENVNPEPAHFDPDRTNPQHLAFGLGVHRCPGSHLAILEAEVAVSLFCQAFPHAQLVGAIDDYAGPTFIGNDLLELPMRLGNAHEAAQH
ncbi:cytochrome P450 [Brevibacterium casei]|uniref:Cytochrome P450 n=2 Tax=Actinomycetes TaxID=1760 RepID=A0A269Z7K2_9MICO|nr:2-hydroxy-5-methyl-1-naphthoate 7-hydroxylase [Microbacterium sp. TNHR37B]PAK93550.1 cytochrome P450 [Brevibacterium casei]